MKYLTIETVLQSFEGCRNKTQNKFWGMVCIIKAIGERIVPAKMYSFSVEKVQTYLEELFRLEDVKKAYSSSNKWSVVFSTYWVDFVPEQMFSSIPNVYDVAAWFYRRTAFDDETTPEQIVGNFIDLLNLSAEDSKKWFSFQPTSYSFDTQLYSENNLMDSILKKLSLSSSSNKTLSFEDQSFIKSNPGSLGQAPFVQTLYANQGIQKCLILTQFDFQDFYPVTNNIKTLPNHNTMTNFPLQKIYYGTPGSGKSHKVKEYLESVYPDENEREKYVFRTTFHPDSDYASFVGCYKPKMDGDNIKYEFTPQAFTEAYVKAWQEPEKQVYLVIEEINRGNCAQIFGDLFQLLDRKGGVSEYPINADADLKQYLEKELDADNEGIANGKLKLPANLNILATMNTSDQSLFPMDSAFKRRWSWECVPIDYTNAVSNNFTITIDGKPYNWHKFLKAVNEKIVSATDSEDKQMGNFFINGDVDERHFVDKVMFYLWNDICKEEFHTKNNFFRNYVDDKKTEKEFSFNELFGSNAQTLLKGFMEYLNVSPKDEEQTNVEEEITIDSESA